MDGGAREFSGAVPGVGRAHVRDRPVPWGGVLLTAFAAVGWAFVTMAAVTALGLHLLGADTLGALGPMTAAVITMAVGGKVAPSGDLSVFGISGAGATGAIDVMPLGVSLAGALALGWVFVRALRRAGAVVGGGEFLARTAAVVVVFLAALAGLVWAGHDTISLAGTAPGGTAPGIGDLNSLGDLGDLGGLGSALADSLGRLAQNHTSVGFRAVMGPSLGGGLLWVLGVLVIALLVTRRGPVPHGWQGLHRVARPAVSALCTVLLLAVAAGLVAALYAAIGDAHPGRVIGGALIGAPNGVWLAAVLGLFVPWHGSASGPLAFLLPHPLDQLLRGGGDHTVTIARLAQLDGRVWLLPVAAVLMLLAAGVLTAARTPLHTSAGATRQAGEAADASLSPGSTGSRGRFAAACAVRLGVVTALACPLLAALTALSVNADLSVFGFDAIASGVVLHAAAAWAFLLGAVWGAVCGAAGALLALATGAAGSRATTLAELTVPAMRDASTTL